MPGTGLQHNAAVTFAEPGDRYYGLFDAPEGVWITAYTRGFPANADLVVRLWNEVGTELLASSDHLLPAYEGIFDGTMYHYADQARTYCMEVLDQRDWAGHPERAGAYSFDARIRTPSAFWGQAQPIVSDDLGTNDTVATAQSLPNEIGARLVLGTFDTDADVDLYTFQGLPQQPSAPARFFSISPPGPESEASHGWGSSSNAILSLLAPDGVTVIARISGADQLAACDLNPDNCVGILTAEAEFENYILKVEREGDEPVLADASYSLFTARTLPPVTAVEPPDNGANDTLATAEILVPQTIDGEPFFGLVGTLEDGDVDWWYVPSTNVGETLRVWCGSAFHGSGVEAFTVEAWADDNTAGDPLQAQTETPTQTIRWWPTTPKVTPPHPGLAGGTGYYFRMSSASFSSEVTSRDYYCRMFRGISS
jgi:hypothetical protein